MKPLMIIPLIILSIGCETPPTICDNYCDMQIDAAYKNAELKQCSVYPYAMDDFEDNCDRTCTNVLEYVVEDKHKQDAEKCLTCIYSTIVEPSQKSIAEAREECFAICSTRGGYQFFYTFYISQPAWDCSERDGEYDYWENR